MYVTAMLWCSRWEDPDGGDPESELVLDHIQIPRRDAPAECFLNVFDETGVVFSTTRPSKWNPNLENQQAGLLPNPNVGLKDACRCAVQQLILGIPGQRSC